MENTIGSLSNIARIDEQLDQWVLSRLPSLAPGENENSRHVLRTLTACHSPGGLVTLKTLLEASTPERPIEARLFEA